MTNSAFTPNSMGSSLMVSLEDPKIFKLAVASGICFTHHRFLSRRFHTV